GERLRPERRDRAYSGRRICAAARSQSPGCCTESAISCPTKRKTPTTSGRSTLREYVYESSNRLVKTTFSCGRECAYGATQWLWMAVQQAALPGPAQAESGR